MNTFFTLFACCIPVKGHKRSVVCDLQRESYIFIPNILFHILTKYKRKSVSDIKKIFEYEKDAEIDDYFNYLIGQEFGFYTDNIALFPNIDVENSYQAKQISNAIIDLDEKSPINFLGNTIEQLSSFFCESLEFRFFFPLSIEKLENIINCIDGSTLRSIEILIEYDHSLTVEKILLLHHKKRRLKKITIHSSSENVVHEHESMYIIFTTQKIGSKNCCGVVSPWYFTPKTEVFIESKKFNSCLNYKISVDVSGEIKNCPSMKDSYGNIQTTTLQEAMDKTGFKDIWNINKDKIEVCKDCEFRYICQDCRAYVQDSNNIYSKPAKCNYDPYEAVWK